jgi:hypothetical protein
MMMRSNKGWNNSPRPSSHSSSSGGGGSSTQMADLLVLNPWGTAKLLSELFSPLLSHQLRIFLLSRSDDSPLDL